MYGRRGRGQKALSDGWGVDRCVEVDGEGDMDDGSDRGREGVVIGTECDMLHRCCCCAAKSFSNVFSTRCLSVPFPGLVKA